MSPCTSVSVPRPVKLTRQSATHYEVQYDNEEVETVHKEHIFLVRHHGPAEAVVKVAAVMHSLHPPVLGVLGAFGGPLASLVQAFHTS